MDILTNKTKPYGYFGSLNALRRAIRVRDSLGQSLTGEAVVFQGAKIIEENGSTRIEDPDRDYPRLEIRVSPKGKFTAGFTPEHEFDGEPPLGWREIENP